MGKMNNLVSIITPSYNCGSYVHRLLNSVLNQTYKNIEMVVVDDGSTDDTTNIVLPYIEKFHETGKKLQYIFKENEGAISAINTGLKLIAGEYLVWPDADDWYATDDAIEQLVFTFENSSDDVGFVRGMQYILDENTLEIARKRGDEHREYPDNLFEYCLSMKASEGLWWFTPGVFMIKTKHLFDSYPDKNIYSGKEGYGGGQNRPLLLPSLYGYKSITVKKFMYNVLSRKNSVSMKSRSYDFFMNKRLAFEEDSMKSSILSLKKMSYNDKMQYIKQISILIDERRFLLAFRFKQKQDCSKYYNKILSEDREKAHAYRYRLRYLFSQVFCGFLICKLLNFMRYKISNLMKK